VIRSTQPHGPYAFLGMSLGSGIAFELAKRFEQSGEAPAFLGILDSPPSGSVMEAAGPSELLVIDILRLRGVLTEKDVDGLKDNHERHGRESTIEKLILLHREALEKSGFTEDSLLAWIRTMDSGVGISQGGEATGKVKNLDLFEAEPVVGWGFTKQQWSAEIRRWDQFASDFQHHEVPGNHLTLIRHPHVQTFREALAKAFLHRGI
ncbi:AMP-dependent synthetase and ligase, partial [Alternaria alternata]